MAAGLARHREWHNIRPMEDQQPPRATPHFAAELRPHRSLTPAGFALLMAFVCVVSFGAGLAFFLKGAWPVVGFFGLDVLAIYVAFKINFASGRKYESIVLYPDELTVARHAPYRKPQLWSFEPTWLRIDLVGEEDQPRRIALRQRGRELFIGDLMPPDERPEFARSLQDALHALRSPTFA